MKKKVTIELPPALHQHLEVFAAQNDLSVARTIRHAIRAHINYVEPAPNIVSQTTERPRELSPIKQVTKEGMQKVAQEWADD
jgi:predicted DNA-binding protein